MLPSVPGLSMHTETDLTARVAELERALREAEAGALVHDERWGFLWRCSRCQGEGDQADGVRHAAGCPFKVLGNQ